MKNMPLRKTPLVTNEIYHIFNRGNASVPIFRTRRDWLRFIQSFLYYRHGPLPMRFSKLFQMSFLKRKKLLDELNKKGGLLVEIIAYCLMPNHFHFILKQTKNDGILNFLRLSSASYSRYFNTKYQRKGSLFEGRFKSVIIKTESQLLHLSRYVHLNPYSSFLVKDFDELIKYPYSSLSEYLGLSKEGICQNEVVLGLFSGPKDYEQFVSDRADYQRSLEEIKHQLLEV